MTEARHSEDCGRTIGGILIVCPRCTREIELEMQALGRFQQMLLNNPIPGIPPVIMKGTL